MPFINVKKRGEAWGRRQHGTRWIRLHARKHTPKPMHTQICSTYCFSTTTVVSSKRFNIALYAHCLSCLTQTDSLHREVWYTSCGPRTCYRMAGRLMKYRDCGWRRSCPKSGTEGLRKTTTIFSHNNRRPVEIRTRHLPNISTATVTHSAGHNGKAVTESNIPWRSKSSP